MAFYLAFLLTFDPSFLLTFLLAFFCQFYLAIRARLSPLASDALCSGEEEKEDAEEESQLY